MTNSTQLANKEIERLPIRESSENGSSVSQTSDLNIELLHHLVNVPRVFQKARKSEIDELIKQNAALINKLLTRPIEPVASATAAGSTAPGPVVWEELLRQKLVAAGLDLTDEKVKEFANKKLEAASKQIDDLIAAFARNAASFGRMEEKLMFEIKVPGPTSRLTNQELVQKVNLHNLIFEVSLYNNPFDLNVSCIGLLTGMMCKAKVTATIKNHVAGQRDWSRAFNIVFNSCLKCFDLADLIREEEYADEGLVKDGKLSIELTIRAEEPVQI